MSKFLSSFTILFLLFFTLNAQTVNDILKKDADPEGFKAIIRIGILTDASSCVIEGDAKVQDEAGKELGSIQGSFKILPQGKGDLKVGQDTYFAKHLIFVPKFSFISLGSRVFRGNLEVYNINGKITVVNDLGIEDYVKGVINKEIMPQWPLEAKKVQAVMARTFAIYQKIFSPRSNLFDLAPTVLDQVYGGLSREDMSANEAVNSTAGEMLSYQNMPAKIYFHSTCGGSTASAKEVWGGAVPYLQPVKCEFCKRSELYRWKRILKSDAVAAKLAEKYGIKKILSIKAEYGINRVKNLLINDKKIDINTFRGLVGFSVVWSNDFTVEMSGGSIVFEGKGAGHGVGCCQWGMSEMARQGKNYRDILDYYFKNAVIKKLY